MQITPRIDCLLIHLPLSASEAPSEEYCTCCWIIIQIVIERQRRWSFVANGGRSIIGKHYYCYCGPITTTATAITIVGHCFHLKMLAGRNLSAASSTVLLSSCLCAGGGLRPGCSGTGCYLLCHS